MRYWLVLLLLCPTVLFAGGPWAMEKGKGYAELSLSSGFSSWIVDLSIQGYLEVGLGKRFTAKLIVPAKYMSTTLDKDNEFVPATIGTASLWGPGNVVAGLAYQLYKKKVVLAAKLDVWGKTTRADDAHGLRTGYEKWSFRPTFSLGQGVGMFYWFTDVYAELNTNNYSHGLGAIAEGGFTRNQKFYVSLYLQYAQNFRNGNFNSTQPAAYALTGFFVDGEQYVSVGLKLAQTVKNGWGINGGLFRIFTISDGSGILSGKLGVYKTW